MDNFETAKEYQNYVDKKSPNSPILKNWSNNPRYLQAKWFYC